MALFESYERRIDQINAELAKHGISSIEEAKQILKNGEKLSIEEVGAMVGIPQSYNFSKWFRTVTGTTPYKFCKYS